MTAHPIFRSRGFSLTELMVAMFIGVVLLGGLVTLMVNTKKNYAQQDYSARLQENARFTMEFLSYDIRMGGYFGCSNDILNDSSITAFSVPASDPNQVTVTYGASYDPDEEIVIDSANYDPYGSGNTLVLNDIPEDWGDGDTLVIADCGSASVADIDSGGINTDDNEVTVTPHNGGFGRVYDQETNDNGPITVRRLVSNTYVVESVDIDSRDPCTPHDPDECIRVLSRNGEELVEGVENIRLLYQNALGADFAAGDTDTEIPLAVKFGALVRSISNENLKGSREYGSGVETTVDKGQYQLLDQDVDAGELRGQRRVFATTLAVRNQPL